MGFIARKHAALCLLAAFWWLGPAVAWGQSQFKPYAEAEGVVQVLEGDVISVGGSVVRLYGIDAPELGQQCEAASGRAYDCGEASRLALERMIGPRELRCTLFAVLEDGRQTGMCRSGDQDVGLLQVRRGWAFVARGLSNRYIKAQTRAQIDRAGLWSGRAQRPWVYRQLQTIQDATGG